MEALGKAAKYSCPLHLKNQDYFNLSFYNGLSRSYKGCRISLIARSKDILSEA